MAPHLNHCLCAQSGSRGSCGSPAFRLLRPLPPGPGRRSPAPRDSSHFTRVARPVRHQGGRRGGEEGRPEQLRSRTRGRRPRQRGYEPTGRVKQDRREATRADRPASPARRAWEQRRFRKQHPSAASGSAYNHPPPSPEPATARWGKTVFRAADGNPPPT